MSIEKLLPCPFCGGPAEVQREAVMSVFGDTEDSEYFVACGANDGCSMLVVMTDMHTTAEAAAGAWNRRAPVASEQERAEKQRTDAFFDARHDARVRAGEER